VASTKDKLIAGAQKLVEKGQFEKAIKEYLKVVQQDDKDVRIWLKIGDLYAKIGKKAEATETYQRVAQFYSDQGFYLKSVAVYKQILKIEPRLVEVNQRLAELYKQLGLLSDAMMQFETVAAFFHREGKTREALAALKQIVELDPETVANRIKLAELYSKEGMAREAIDEFGRAAEQLREAGRTDDFMKVAERLLFHSPDNRPVSKELARLYIEKGDPRRALPKLQVCFKADPRDAEVLSLLASAFEALDQRSKAVSVLKELARILGENGDSAGRIEVYRRIADLEPNDAEAEAVLSGVRRPSAVPVVAPAPPPPPPPIPSPPLSRTGGWIAVRGQTDEMPPSAVHEFDDAPSVTATGQVDDDDIPPPPPSPVTTTSVGQLLEPGESGGARGGGEEEIQRILNETDVYIKYKLYSKAIEHVQRVFELDGKHVEAREKLKALFLTIGKKEEAVLELWSLAEQAEAGRQRRYLREILELDPGNERAAGLLGVEADSPLQPSSPSTSSSPSDDQIEELDDNEFDVAEPSRLTQAPPPDDDLIPVVVEPLGAAAGGNGDDSADDRFGLPPEHVEDRFGFGDADESGAEVSAALPLSDSEVQAVDAGVKAVSARSFNRPEPTGDHDLHTRFDDQAMKFIEQQALFGGNDEIDENDLPPLGNLPPAQGTATQRAPAHLVDDEEAASANPPTLREPLKGSAPPPTAARASSSPAAPAAPAPGPTAERPDSSLEDDLDEADFFTQQSLFDEARTILEQLLARHPSHPLVTAKLRDLEAMERGGAPAAEAAPANDEPIVEESPPPSDSEVQAVRAPDLSAELPADLPGGTDASIAAGDVGEPFEMTRKGVIEKGVTAEDFETHYDLGIAYKEMGLLDDAVAEFKLCMKDPTREVQCHLMIGLCCLEKGQVTEAIGHFKKGLYVEGITERESLSLYFELGQAYERLNDPREALYYYEKVIKRDAHFRGVEQRIEALRGGVAEAPAAPTANPDDVDAAFDSLLGDEP
jgi:pilus assembly protein FimV